ncbi:hypothetical protein ATKI12_4617 [Kitasatospora sp. Ki12]|uniref:hypothetical protein n=1 Tax=Kitasatospora xanthocidica TaxID=83382 RepID=UPI00167481A8|nr:hypothetical protein [Kitasatospora xanthocidica]GHF59639.1 hypothetical protein GCM10018790_41950 [Kitasatospora xanthocidica]
MTGTASALRASGLPRCWAVEFAPLRSPAALREAVRHTAESLDRAPALQRWGLSVALRLFPAAFLAVSGRFPRSASPAQLRAGLARLRGVPGYAEVLRATTALALYGALDGPASREALR